jgi:hypothetical protein
MAAESPAVLKCTAVGAPRRPRYPRRPPAHVMKGQHPGEYCLMMEGPYLSVSEAEHALRDPFIEDWVEQTGRFRIHNLNEMMIVPGVPLGQLGLEMLDERVFQLYSLDPRHPLTERKAEGVADALKRQDMFDEIRVEPRWPEDGEDAGAEAE